VALVALGELGGDVVATGSLHHVAIEAHLQFVEERPVAP
jgi:hypothetical protein